MFLLRLTSSDQTASFSFTSLTSNVRVAPPIISILRINQRRQLTKVLILVIEEFFCWLTWDRVSSPRITIGKMRRHHHSPTFSKTPGWFQTIVNVMWIPHSSFRKHTFQVAPPRSLGWFGLGREQMGLWWLCKTFFLFLTKWSSSGCRWVKHSPILQAEMNEYTYMLRLYTSSCKTNTEPALILHSKSVTIFDRPLAVFRVYRLQHW